MSSTYDVSEIYTDVVQGEGYHAGLPCSVLRLGRCNLWPDALKPSVTCPWCDTAVLHRYEKREKAVIFDELRFVQSTRPHHGLILTGGEPLLQLDADLMCAVSDIFPWVDVETNGTVALKTAKYDNVFVSCSPKTATVKVKADWFKVLIPDKESLLKEVMAAAQDTNAIVYVQPVEIGGYASKTTQENIRKCMEICNRFGTVRLSLQIHKIAGVR